jgi:hypothetical protein
MTFCSAAKGEWEDEREIFGILDWKTLEVGDSVCGLPLAVLPKSCVLRMSQREKKVIFKMCKRTPKSYVEDIKEICFSSQFYLENRPVYILMKYLSTYN